MKQWQGRTQLLRLSLNGLLRSVNVLPFLCQILAATAGRTPGIPGYTSARGSAEAWKEAAPQTAHLKEHSAKSNNALIGQGDIPWKEVFRLCGTVGGAEWYIVEQGTYACPLLVTVEKCLKNLRAMGK